MKKYFSSYWIRSAFYSFLQRFSVTLFGLVNFMVLIRSLSKPQMGTWALFLAVTSIFEATKSNLLKNAHIRFCSSTNDLKEKVSIASSSILINCLLTSLFILFVLFFGSMLSSWLNEGVDLSGMLLWFIPGLISMIFFSHFESVQQSNLDFKGGFAGYFIRQLTFFAIIVTHAVFKVPFSMVNLAIYQSVSILLGTFVLFLFTKKYLHYKFNVSKQWIRKIFNYGGYIFGSGMVANIFASVDQFMSAKFLSGGAVATYNAATRINGIVDMPSYAASSIIFPKISRASFEEGTEKVKYLYEKMVALLLSITLPASIFVIIFPTFVITIIAGTEYKDAAPILQLYMLASILRPMINQASNLLNSIGKPQVCFIINSVSLAIYLVINYFSLLYFGFYGAAIGTFVTTCIGFIIWYFIMKKEIGSGFKGIFKPMVSYYKDFFILVKSLTLKAKSAAI